MSSEEQSEQTLPQSVNVGIQWNIPDAIQAQFVTNFVVQKLQHEYLLSFFQILPPILLGTPEELTEQVAQLGNKIQAKCVYQTVLAPERLQELITVLQNATQLPSAFTENVPPPSSHR